MKLWLEEERKTYTASEDFKSNLEGGFRYVDKTELLIPLLEKEHETTFFLRPRRFGKTLTLSMIRYFVEDTRDEKLNKENRELFQDLKIMKSGEKYICQMTSYPVIDMTMQSVKGKNYDTAHQQLCERIKILYRSKDYLLNSNCLSEEERRYYFRILLGEDETGQKRTDADLINSLMHMTRFLRRESGKKAVVLIDEYDVPMEKAYQGGYYPEMVALIGPMMQNVLKTNSENLHFAVVTGCLRIAKEGIYTGLNNPEVNTVLSNQGGDAIGFTEEETRKLLKDSGLSDHFEQVREWYDGYRFGNHVIYNPWSVIKYIEDHNARQDAPPLTYWANTSGNLIIRELAGRANENQRSMIETLIQGGEVAFALQDNIVYDELYKKPDNVWNVMLSAGYLTATAFDGETIHARIPNREVLKIYRDQVKDWFQESMESFDIRSFYAALEQGNTAQVERILNEEFLSAMSYYDSKEAFYHGVLLTLMQLNREFHCDSNRESGKGRFDIMARNALVRDQAIILEVKLSDRWEHMLEDAQSGVAQIEKKAYVRDLERLHYQRIMTYGIAFHEKSCVVVAGRVFGMMQE